MQDTELLYNLLGLQEPWSVERVELNLEDRRLDVWATHTMGVTWTCPECALASPTRDHAAERLWRHLDSCQFETYIHARIPRVACREHGVRQIHVPWAEPDSRFTKQFERLAVGILAECKVSGTAAVLGLTWDEAQGMRERAARRREARKHARGLESRAAGQAMSRLGNGRTSSNGNGSHPSAPPPTEHAACRTQNSPRGKMQKHAG
jgi:transposase